MKAIKDKLIDACIMVTITLVMLTGLEVTARIVRQVKIRFFLSTEVPPSPQEAILLKHDWGRQLIADTSDLTEVHRTYVEFRERPYSSATINVDNESRRRVPHSCEMETAFTVLMFGGSTMFGAGVPDEFTIPAYLADIVNGGGRCIKVVNYGAGWWQSSQSLIQLIQALKADPPPQAVVFYDGINDVNAVAFGGVPGGIDPEIDAWLKQAFVPDPGPDKLLQEIAQSSVLVRGLRNLLVQDRAEGPEPSHVIAREEMPELVKATADIYARNVRSVNALAKEYGFTAYFFLQPFPLISGKKITDSENQAFASRRRNGEWEPEFIRMCYQAFRENPYLRAQARYYDISGIFDGLTEELYFDDGHLLPNGNKIVAERMAREIELPQIKAVAAP